MTAQELDAKILEKRALLDFILTKQMPNTSYAHMLPLFVKILVTSALLASYDAERSRLPAGNT